MNPISIKQTLYNHCVHYVQERLRHIQSAIATAQESANDESKSSAGDKHETARAMAQLEQEKLAQQLSETDKLSAALTTIEPDKALDTIQMGTLVTTNHGNYYLSISAGKLSLDGTLYFFLSPASPIGQELIKNQKKKKFTFNGQNYLIKSYC